MLEIESGPLKSSAKTSFMPLAAGGGIFGHALVPGNAALVVELEVAIVLDRAVVAADPHGDRAMRILRRPGRRTSRCPARRGRRWRRWNRRRSRPPCFQHFTVTLLNPGAARMTRVSPFTSEQ